MTVPENSPATILMRRAYAYIRFSSLEQRKGDSLKRQLREAQDWCKRNNAVLDDSLDFLNELGHTGFDGSNLEEGGGLGLFLAAIKAGRVAPGSVLLVEKLDRFSRTDIDIAVAFFGKVLRAGVNIVSIKSGMEYSADMLRRQPTAIITAVLEFILANEESVKKSDRMLSAHAGKRERARQGIPQSKRGPLWLKLVNVEGDGRRGQNGEKWAEIPDRVKVVQRIFGLSADGVGAYRMAALFNKEGVPPMERLPHWTQKAIQRILINRAVLGEFQPQRKVKGRPVNDGPPVPGYFLAVVDVGLFHRAQQAANGRKTGGRQAGGRAGKLFVFQKMAYDAVSGSTLVVKASNSAGGYIRYLMPSAGLRGGARITFPVDVFERAILKCLAELSIDDVLPSQERTGAELAEVSGQLAELAHRIDETTRAMADQPPSLMGAIVKMVATWEAEKAQLARRHEELRAQAPIQGASPLGEMRSIVAMLDECQGDECDRLRAKLRAVLRSMIKSVHAVIVKRSRYEYLAEVQVRFQSGGFRSYTIAHRSSHGNKKVMHPGILYTACARDWGPDLRNRGREGDPFDEGYEGVDEVEGVLQLLEVYTDAEMAQMLAMGETL